MMIFLYQLITAYIIPGMMLAFGLCLLFLTVPQRTGLKNYMFARKTMGATFIVYFLALIIEAISRSPLAGDLLNNMIVVAIGATQAYLFTYSLICLLDINFLTKWKVWRETFVVATVIIVAFAAFSVSRDGIAVAVFHVFTLCYVLQMARYVVLFNRYYKSYRQRMDNYFSDDERQRLRWVPMAFYSATGIGVIALLFAFMITPLTQLLFMLAAVVYYSVFAIRFINYVHVFPIIEKPMDEAMLELPSSPAEQDMTPTDDDQDLMRQIEVIMNNEELFKTPNLSIANIAVLCGKSHRLVSMAINHCHGTNFKTYVNEFRVDYCIHLIESGWLRQHTLESLATEAGFANRVNLYRAFKRKTGVSPADWNGDKAQ